MEIDLEPPKEESGRMSSIGMDSIGVELNKIAELAEIIGKKKKFADLPLSEPTIKAIKEIGLDWMDPYEAVIIQLLLQGKDVMAAVKMFIRKESAILIPAVEMLYQSQFTHQKGIGAICICTTRLLATHMYLFAKSLLRYHSLTVELVGGLRFDSQEMTLEGVNLLIATPSSLLDHLQKAEGLICRNLKYLMIDEVDQMVKLGFEEEVRKTIDILPKMIQTISLSSEQTMKGEVLARLSLPATGVLISYEEMKGSVPALSSCPSKGLPIGDPQKPSFQGILLLSKPQHVRDRQKRGSVPALSSCPSKGLPIGDPQKPPFQGLIARLLRSKRQHGRDRQKRAVGDAASKNAGLEIKKIQFKATK